MKERKEHAVSHYASSWRKYNLVVICLFHCLLSKYCPSTASATHQSILLSNSKESSKAIRSHHATVAHLKNPISFRNRTALLSPLPSATVQEQLVGSVALTGKHNNRFQNAAAGAVSQLYPLQ